MTPLAAQLRLGPRARLGDHRRFAGGFAARAEPALELPGRQRRANEVALRGVASALSEEIQLALLLDAFRHDVQAETAREADDRRGDRGAAAILAARAVVRFDVRDEALVDLEHVHRQVPQVRKARE